MHINSAVTLACDGTGNVVANPERPIAFATALPQSSQRVRRFSALANREHQSVTSHGSVTMPKLAGELDLGRNAGELFNEIFPHHPGMQRRSATGQHHPANVTQLRRRHIQAPSFAVHSSRLSRPRMASRTVLGCSKISLSM